MADYLIGRGKLKAGLRDANGYPLALVDLGECPQIELMTDVTYADNFTTAGALSRQDLHVPTRAAMSMNVTMKEKNLSNLVKLLNGEQVAVSSGSVTNSAWPTGIAAGEERRLPALDTNVTSLVLTDSAGTPATLTSGTHYTADLKRGTVKFINLASFVQPFKAAYTKTAGNVITMLQNIGLEYWFEAEILDISKRPNQLFQVELYRGVMDQPQSIQLKGEEVNTFQVKITGLDDDTKSESAGDPFGRFGRWIPIG